MAEQTETTMFKKKYKMRSLGEDGLNTVVSIPRIVLQREADKQGIIHKALQNSIPVIHLLNIKGLAIEYGLKWDPVVKSDE